VSRTNAGQDGLYWGQAGTIKFHKAGGGMSRFVGLSVLLVFFAGSALGQENLLVPSWKRNADGSPYEKPEAYTGKYCSYPEFEGLEFEFSTDPVHEKYGFQLFHEKVNDYKSLPFSEFSGKKGKIGGAASRGFREVLMEDCTTAYVMSSGAIEAGSARGLGIIFLQAPPTDWAASEQVDRLTDAKSCHVVARGADMPFPMFFYHSKEGFSANAVGGDFPGRPITFRVDRHPAIVEREGLSGARAQMLANQIRAGGKQLLLGAYEWPHDVEIVKEFNLDGLAPLLDQCRSYVKAP